MMAKSGTRNATKKELLWPSIYPGNPLDVLDWNWNKFKSYYDELASRPLDASSLDPWMRDWTSVASLVSEAGNRLHVALDLHAVDADLEARYTAFLESILEPAQAAEQVLKEKLLASGLEPEGFAIPLRNMRTEAALFKAENLALFTEHEKTALEYDKVVGSRMVKWQGKEYTLTRLVGELVGASRDVREEGWRLAMDCTLSDSPAIDDVLDAAYGHTRHDCRERGLRGFSRLYLEAASALRI